MRCPLCRRNASQLIRWDYRILSGKPEYKSACVPCKGRLDYHADKSRREKRMVHAVGRGKDYAISAAHREDIKSRRVTHAEEDAVAVLGKDMRTPVGHSDSVAGVSNGIWRDKKREFVYLGGK